MSITAFIEAKKTENMKLKFTLIIFAFLFVVVTTPAFAQSDDLVILQTKSGDLVIEFFTDDAPNHVENFINLTESGFYNRTIFHRVIEGFMIQGGDPLTKPGAYELTSQWGTGGPVDENGTKLFINEEFNDIKHNRGILSMARSQNPNSAGSQFFIVHKDSNFLDGEYTVFGRLVTQESFETLDKIATLETAANDIPLKWGEGEILKAEVVSSSEVSNLLELGDPERITQSIITPPPSLSENYSSDEFGFSTTFPTGWLVQEPEKIQPGTPDVTSVGPISDGFNPSISVTIGESKGKTLKELIDERKNSLQVAIDSGQLVIDSEEFTKVDGKDAHIMTVTSNFVTSAGNVTIKFKEIIIDTPEKLFQVTYVNSEKNFDKDVQLYDETVDSFKILSEDSNPTNGGGCLIATSTFGSELAPQVQQLRETRDNILLKTESGKSFLMSFNQFYYSFSPTIADLERQNPIFKETVKVAITPLLTSLSILNHVEINSENEMLGYGISLILLNIGMYFAAPAYIFYRLRK
jgi:peptidyl-prolyl cis-trans isomerase B (cyclophilin B)